MRTSSDLEYSTKWLNKTVKIIYTKLKILQKKLHIFELKLAFYKPQFHLKEKKNRGAALRGGKKKQNKEVAADWLHFILFNETG